MTSGQTSRPHHSTFIKQALREKPVLVIFNPKSGQGGSGLDAFVELLRAAGLSVEERALEGERPMRDYVADLERFGAVVGAGGDGTVSSLAYAMRGQGVPLLAYPAGTANLIAQNLDIPEDPRALAELFLSGRTLTVDLGELETGPEQERQGFAMLAGAGADANMIKESEGLKKNFGAMAYVIAAMRQVSPSKTTFHVTADGGETRSFEGIGVMLANFGMANYRIPITSDISPSDGQFTVILLKAGNILQLVPNVIDSLRAKFNLGDPAFSNNIETFMAREVTVVADDPFPLQFDGEIHLETTPFTARVLPGAIQFFSALSEEDLAT